MRSLISLGAASAIFRNKLNWLPSAKIANFSFELAREFNQYYHEVSVLHEENAPLREQRLLLLSQVSKLLNLSMELLGIVLPERM